MLFWATHGSLWCTAVSYYGNFENHFPSHKYTCDLFPSMDQFTTTESDGVGESEGLAC